MSDTGTEKSRAILARMGEIYERLDSAIDGDERKVLLDEMRILLAALDEIRARGANEAQLGIFSGGRRS